MSDFCPHWTIAPPGMDGICWECRYDALAASYDQARAFNDRASARIREIEAQNDTEREETMSWMRQATDHSGRIEKLEAALRKLVNEVGGSLRGFEPEIRAAIGNTNWECIMLRVREGAALLLPTTAETGAEPGIGPIEPAPQDYKVQCRCGWMGQVSALKSLPDFKMGCPDCSAEFVPLDKMAFPVKTGTKP